MQTRYKWVVDILTKLSKGIVTLEVSAEEEEAQPDKIQITSNDPLVW